MQLHADLSEFDLVEEKATELDPRGSLLAVLVKGLAENRPSVLKGDMIRVNFVGGGQKWRGRAESIEEEVVILRFDPRFHAQYIRRQKVEIQFINPHP